MRQKIAKEPTNEEWIQAIDLEIKSIEEEKDLEKKENLKLYCSMLKAARKTYEEELEKQK